MRRMKVRRALLGAMGAGLLLPRLALAQPARQMSVTVLFAGNAEDDEPATRPFFDEMRRLGWAEGVNITYERLFGQGMRAYVDGLARSAASRTPDLIYATTATIALAVIRATDSVPVVFTVAADPVASGLVDSLARPGRNATGAFQPAGEVVARRLELVREIFPGLKRIGVVFDRGGTSYAQQKELHLDAARRIGLEAVAVEFTNYEAMFKILARFRRDGIFVAVLAPSFTLFSRRREVSAVASRNEIALVTHRVEWTEAGGLLSYGAQIAEALQRSAAIAGRILKGARPADIPVEQAAKVELAVNQRTAKALGLTLPRALLQRAHRVIE